LDPNRIFKIEKDGDMSIVKLFGGTLLVAIMSLSALEQSVAWPVMTGVTADNMVVNVRAVKGGGGRAGGRTNVNASHHTNVNVSKHTNVNVNKRTNVNVNAGRNVNVVRRPVRAWGARPYYGTIVGGVALGSFIAVSAMGVAPVAPASNMCWFWTDSSQMSGYWDYCQGPY
jgi:hypothetical protein